MTAMDEERRPLADLSARLLRLHGLLLALEREDYEAAHGAVTSRELLQLLLGDDRFAWLRSLSRLIARIDEAVDVERTGIPADAEAFHRETHLLLRSGGTDAFTAKYAAALQASADVVMAHADVVKALPRPPRAGEERGRS